MTLITWTDELGIGVPEVDAQHQRLVELVNAFDDAATQGRGTREIGGLLTSLTDYAVEHFADEETTMRNLGYPDLDRHTRLHRQLVAKLEDLRVQYEVNGRRITRPMLELLRYWLLEHIRGADTAIGRYAATAAPASVSRTSP
ncbi:MAG: bacteriohemerythrin [Candidatus Krumholzibacteriia bacterium]